MGVPRTYHAYEDMTLGALAVDVGLAPESINFEFRAIHQQYNVRWI